MLPKNMEELELAKKTYLEFAEKIVAKGGAVAAEHGIGRLKKKFLQAQYTEKDFESFKKIKLFFDPENRLNSHVLV
jgi:FAD/FMN-containing dehydrogenase